MSNYNKLVRDRVPERIKNAGEQPITQTLDTTAYKEALKKKLIEEANECAAAHDEKALTAELADLEEVILALLRVYAIDPHDIEHERQNKHESHGGFEARVFLQDVQ